MMTPARQSDRSEELRHARAAQRRGETARSERELDVLRGGERGDQVELLEHEADRPESQLRQLRLPERREVAALEDDFAARRPVEAAEQLKERRLAGAARTRS